MSESGPNSSIGRNSMEQGPEEGRAIALYEKVLKFKKEDLENKVVLDLGAGPKARFARDLEESGVHATVISLSPEYANEKQRALFKGEDRRGLEVAGIGEKLPFQDESFDEVLALYSVSIWSAENYKKWLPEICRVLKLEGIARIGTFNIQGRDTRRTSEDISGSTHQEEQREWIEDFIQGLGYAYKFVRGPGTRQDILIIHKGDNVGQ